MNTVRQMKYYKDTIDFPISWKTEIDGTKNTIAGENKNEVIPLNCLPIGTQRKGQSVPLK